MRLTDAAATNLSAAELLACSGRGRQEFALLERGLARLGMPLVLNP